MTAFNVLNVAASALTAQSMRLNTTASNLANAESAVSSNGQPYRAKHVVFEPVASSGGMGLPQDAASQGVRVTAVVEDQSQGRQVFEPGNPMANAEGYVTMPNVDPAEEMVNMISATRAYQTNVEMMNSAKSLMLKALTIGE